MAMTTSCPALVEEARTAVAGAVAVAFDTSELSLLTAELMALGMKEKTIRKIMGENVVRFLGENLPLD